MASRGAVAPDAIHFDSCPRRIFAPTADATIVSINADNGQLCTDFGDKGVIGLYQGMSMTQRGFLNPTSPPVVTQHVLIVSASVTDNDSTHEPSGVIRGYDIDSGRLLWNWDSANPDETAPLAPGQFYKHNSPNSWSVSSVDEKLGMVYIPMGNQTPDMWGGNRYPEGEKFNSSIVALDIATGKLRWVFQTVHHDLWDMDVGGQPNLMDMDTPQGKVPVVIASTKRADIYVIDRRDGKLVVPAPEQPVPQGAAEGDYSAPTQPFSALSFKPERRLRESDMWGTNPFDQLTCRILFKQLRYDGIFTPPSEQGSLIYPGNYGVFDWGGLAIDPVRQVLVGNPNYVAFVSRLHRRDTVRYAVRDRPASLAVTAGYSLPGATVGLCRCRRFEDHAEGVDASQRYGNRQRAPADSATAGCAQPGWRYHYGWRSGFHECHARLLLPRLRPAYRQQALGGALAGRWSSDPDELRIGQDRTPVRRADGWWSRLAGHEDGRFVDCVRLAIVGSDTTGAGPIGAVSGRR
jgi:glucose dehydrogenase